MVPPFRVMPENRNDQIKSSPKEENPSPTLLSKLTGKDLAFPFYAGFGLSGGIVGLRLPPFISMIFR
ncbi:uncharacterized protein Dvar_72210 [Desulfosarcina variabilis str. Montpellier]|uniref:hypothetical protein n=1 Tax=Desulfosarcina variabilis TaxID=2300 RepID=UPI003AFA89F8